MSGRCVCCAGRELHALAYRDEFVGRPLRQCRDCGHMQVETLPDAEQLQRFYTTHYSAARSDMLSERYLRIMERRARAQLDFCERKLALSESSLLDLGCGYGSLVASAAARGADARGVDFDPQAVAYARRQGILVEGVDSECFLAAMVMELVPKIVTLSHSLEHLRDPERMLSACEQSFVFIEVPAYDAKLAAQFVEQEGHLNFFTSQSLARLLARLQFEPLALASYGPARDLFWRRRLRPLKRLRQALSGDYFFGQYDRVRERGIWIRALAKGRRCAFSARHGGESRTSFAL